MFEFECVLLGRVIHSKRFLWIGLSQLHVPIQIQIPFEMFNVTRPQCVGIYIVGGIGLRRGSLERARMPEMDTPEV